MLRRDFLEFVRCTALAAAIPNDWRVRFRPRFVDDPFGLGVASGDPTSNSVILWTRLAPRPLDPDGGVGGTRPVVSWELAADEGFGSILQRGRATAAPELGHSIHVDVQGLDPNRWYFYRFMSGDAVSAIGRTRTAPPDGATQPLRLGVASCQHYEQGLFTAYRHMAVEELDMIAHLGDYIYEYGPAEGQVRRHSAAEILGLPDYRVRYAQYKSDEHLRAAHQRCPWIVTWDDHEVDNNYAGLIGENRMESEEQMRARRAAAYQAWWENQPVRVPRVRSWSDLTIRRGFKWGELAHIWVLDTRQYRSDQACDDGNREVPCAEWSDPSRTMMGNAQEGWLTAGLAANRASWQVLAQQVMVAPYDGLEGPKQRVSMDQWSGYPVARDRLLRTIGQSAPNRTVVLTGDIHSNWVNELRSSFSRSGAPTVAAEFVGTSISSGGDGVDRYPTVNDRAMAENPHLKWQNARRGYMTCTVTPEEWLTAYRTVPFVSRPDAPISTATTWRLERGRPGILAV
ncbi:MAG: alkaline phosphatase [Gemmatimonadales bacterium]|nr:alkaline phosphatase [Gemmatimonadales bacterium]